ncbi:MAG: LD-carboxypeptidase [Bacteroidales bacterium]|nr:LD-carboxypeptidase [Bacteroidales bacterium]
MNNLIPPLQAGDLVSLVAPARKVSPSEMAPARALLQSWGLRVREPDGLYEAEGQLAGSDAHRAALLQRELDDPKVRALLCCRGGYGTVRIVDRLDFTRFALNPKWIVGYSDATVLHSHLHATLGLPTLHATMPINFPAEGENADTRSLRAALFGQQEPPLEWQPTPHDRPGRATGTLVGGNLSILYSLLGSRSQIDTRGKILLIEDLDEYLYHLDRMMQALRRAGMLEGLNGLIVGHMSDMHDNSVPFGKTVPGIVLDAMAGTRCPIAFGAPVGHCVGANYAITLGRSVTLETSVSKNSCIFAP